MSTLISASAASGPSVLSTSYPYPISSRSNTHHAILHPSSPYAPSHSNPDDHFPGHVAGPGPSTAQLRQRREREAMLLKRAQDRVIMGKRPAGCDLDREADELSEEERMMEDERDNINLFGHRFLLPYGRRQTQSELDAAPRSPTPQQDADDRGQEDRVAGSSPLPTDDHTGDGETGDTEAEGVDLDADVEDMDASGDQEGFIDDEDE